MSSYEDTDTIPNECEGEDMGVHKMDKFPDPPQKPEIKVELEGDFPDLIGDPPQNLVQGLAGLAIMIAIALFIQWWVFSAHSIDQTELEDAVSLEISHTEADYDAEFSLMYRTFAKFKVEQQKHNQRTNERLSSLETGKPIDKLAESPIPKEPVHAQATVAMIAEELKIRHLKTGESLICNYQHFARDKDNKLWVSANNICQDLDAWEESVFEYAFIYRNNDGYHVFLSQDEFENGKPSPIGQYTSLCKLPNYVPLATIHELDIPIALMAKAAISYENERLRWIARGGDAFTFEHVHSLTAILLNLRQKDDRDKTGKHNGTPDTED